MSAGGDFGNPLEEIQAGVPGRAERWVRGSHSWQLPWLPAPRPPMRPFSLWRLPCGPRVSARFYPPQPLPVFGLPTLFATRSSSRDPSLGFLTLQSTGSVPRSPALSSRSAPPHSSPCPAPSLLSIPSSSGLCRLANPSSLPWAPPLVPCSYLSWSALWGPPGKPHAGNRPLFNLALGGWDLGVVFPRGLREVRVLPKVGSRCGGGPRKLLDCFHLGGELAGVLEDMYLNWRGLEDGVVGEWGSGGGSGDFCPLG